MNSLTTRLEINSTTGRLYNIASLINELHVQYSTIKLLKWSFYLVCILRWYWRRFQPQCSLCAVLPGRSREMSFLPDIYNTL